MKQLEHIRAGLCALLLGIACAAAWAQPASVPAGEAPPARAAEATSSLPSSIPLRRDGEAPAVRNGQWAMAFWGLLVLGGAAWFWARRRRKGRAEGPRSGWAQWFRPMKAAEGSGPRLMGQTRLTPRHSLHAVQWHGAEFLIACSDHGTQLIARHPPETGSPTEGVAP